MPKIDYIAIPPVVVMLKLPVLTGDNFQECFNEADENFFKSIFHELKYRAVNELLISCPEDKLIEIKFDLVMQVNVSPQKLRF